ncbi:hypothetical protein HR51_24465 [Burkholderia cepacia]|nr:hypothetical protein HR51_24465 [Burkholderia cepacia]
MPRVAAGIRTQVRLRTVEISNTGPATAQPRCSDSAHPPRCVGEHGTVRTRAGRGRRAFVLFGTHVA